MSGQHASMLLSHAQVEAALRSGPGRDLDIYMRALQQLAEAVQSLAAYLGDLQAAQDAHAAASQVRAGVRFYDLVCYRVTAFPRVSVVTFMTALPRG